VKYGLIPELVGRMPVMLSLDSLNEDALVRILTEPKNALIKQYQYLFELDGAKLEFDEDALREIAKLAVERKTGARGLRSILEAALMDTMFDLPGSPDVISCTVTRDTVMNGAAPLIVKESKSQSIAGKKASRQTKPQQSDAS